MVFHEGAAGTFGKEKGETILNFELKMLLHFLVLLNLFFVPAMIGFLFWGAHLKPEHTLNSKNNSFLSLDNELTII